MKALYEAGKAAARKQWAEKENQSWKPLWTSLKLPPATGIAGTVISWTFTGTTAASVDAGISKGETMQHRNEVVRVGIMTEEERLIINALSPQERKTVLIEAARQKLRAAEEALLTPQKPFDSKEADRI